MKQLLILGVLLFHLPLPANPRLKCEKKWGEVKFQGKVLKRYRLRAEDFPEGQRFHLFVKWFNGEEADTFVYIANRRGHLILESEERRKDPLYAICPLKRGERLAFLMKAEGDPSFSIHTSLVPFPVQHRTKSGLVLSLELTCQEGQGFLLKGTGFSPKERFEFSYSLEEKNGSYPVTATDTGAIELPFTVKGTGEGTISLQRASEEVVFPFSAGEEALEIAGGVCLEIQ